MTSAKQEERLAQAALTVPAVTGQWHYPAPGTATSGCFVAQAKAPQHSKQADLTTSRREAEGARALYTDHAPGRQGHGLASKSHESR